MNRQSPRQKTADGNQAYFDGDYSTAAKNFRLTVGGMIKGSIITYENFNVDKLQAYLER